MSHQAVAEPDISYTLSPSPTSLPPPLPYQKRWPTSAIPVAQTWRTPTPCTTWQGWRSYCPPIGRSWCRTCEPDTPAQRPQTDWAHPSAIHSCPPLRTSKAGHVSDNMGQRDRQRQRLHLRHHCCFGCVCGCVCGCVYGCVCSCSGSEVANKVREGGRRKIVDRPREIRGRHWFGWELTGEGRTTSFAIFVTPTLTIGHESRIWIHERLRPY